MKAALKGLGRLAAELMMPLLRLLGPRNVSALVQRLRSSDEAFADAVFHYVSKLETFAPPSAALSLLIDDGMSRRLDEIPSETTAAERRFLFRFFADVWSGKGSVVEVGPFLGGSTRAVALGMLQNPRRSPESRLYTYDRFAHYYTNEMLLSFCAPLFASGVLVDADRASVGVDGSFLNIFDRIHKRCDYGELVCPIDGGLPQSAEEASQPRAWFALQLETEPSAFFVDGCKTWYATKFFMRACCAVARPGSFFLFQDYLQYTCFWVPGFLAMFPEHFSAVLSVDQTYVFRLNKPLPATIIDAFPDTPDTMGREGIHRLFHPLVETAAARKDLEAKIKHTLQLVAALTYIGEKTEARAILSRLWSDPGAAYYLSTLRAAEHSPTYRPNGQGWEDVLLADG